MVDTFSLKSSEEVATFENLLDQYEQRETGLISGHIRLLDAYNVLKSRPDGERVFAALLDVKLNFLLMCLDRHRTRAVRNTYFSDFFGKRLEADSVLDSRDAFFAKMDILRSSTAFVLRYRALFDKIMGLIILTFAPNDYESFCSARRKRKSFTRIASDVPQVPNEMIEQIDKLLTEFDDRFRTPEAHGTGVFRKWVFLMQSHCDSPEAELVDFYNYMNGLVVNLGKLFRENVTS